jgi:hypothetical protein
LRTLHLKDYRWLKLPTNDCPQIHKSQYRNTIYVATWQHDYSKTQQLHSNTDSEVEEISKNSKQMITRMTNKMKESMNK